MLFPGLCGAILMTSPIRCLCLLVACLISLAAQAGRAGSQQPDETTSGARLSAGAGLSDKEGPFLGLGVTYFQALRHAKFDQARLEKNLALFAKRGVNYIRVLSMVSWDELEIAPVSFTNRQGRLVEGWPDYWDHFRDLLDIAAKHHLRVEVTIFADAQVVMPSLAARQAHLDELLKNIAGREQHILFLEVANEAWQNGFPGRKESATCDAARSTWRNGRMCWWPSRPMMTPVKRGYVNSIAAVLPTLPPCTSAAIHVLPRVAGCQFATLSRRKSRRRSAGHQ